MSVFAVSAEKLGKYRITGGLVAGAAMCALLLSVSGPVSAQESGTATQAALKQDGVPTQPGDATGLDAPLSPLAVELQAIIDANTDPDTLVAELADAIAASCAEGACSEATAAALDLASRPAADGSANPAASAIGSALGQVAEGFRASNPEFAEIIDGQVGLVIQECAEGGDGGFGACTAVAAFSAQGQNGDVITTTTAGTPGTGA